MNAILLHGRPDKEEYYDATAPSCSNAHWFPWLQKQLQIKDIYTQTPEVPNAWKPHYPTWQKEFERFDINPTTMLVGHSCGGGFIVRWLSEHPDVRVGKVVLVAPSLGLDWPDRSFFDFTIDPTIVSRTKGIAIFSSTDDEKGVLQAVDQLRNTLTGVAYVEFSDRGHFTLGSMGSPEFPELRDELLHEVA